LKRTPITFTASNAAAVRGRMIEDARMRFVEQYCHNALRLNHAYILIFTNTGVFFAQGV